MKESSKISTIFNNSIIYAICGLLLKCFNFFLLPLYTAYLTTEDYGITSLINSFITTASFIVAFSLYSAVMRFYVDLKNDTEKLKRFYGTVIIFTLISSIISAILLTLLKNILTDIIFKGINFYPIILVCLGSLVFYCQHSIYENVLKSQQKAKKHAIISIIYFFVSLILNILFVVTFKMGALGVILAGMIANITYFLYFIIDMIKYNMITFCVDFHLLKSALKYSIPIIPHNISTQLAVFISKIFINGTTSLSDVGLYSIASQFGNIADTIQNYSSSAYTPWLFERLKSKDDGYKNDIRKAANVISAVLGLFFLGISLFAQDYIILFLNDSYANAWKMVPFVVGVYTIKTMYYFYVGILFYYKKASRYLFIATLSSSLLNILLSYFIIPIWGAYGSILADAISMILRVLIIVVISKRFDDVGLKIKEFIFRIIVIICFIVVGLFFSYTKYAYEFNI